MSTLSGNGKGPAVAPPEQGRAVRPRARPEAEYVVAAPAGLWTGPRALEAQVDAVTREFGPHVYDGLMLWDDVVSSSLDVLLRGALQNGVNIHPAVEDQDDEGYEAAKELAEWCETQLDGLPRPLDDWLYEMGQKALAGGNAVAEQTYRDEGAEWVLDRINTKPRDSALWVVDRFSNTLGILPAGPGNPNQWGPGYLPAGPEDRPRWLPPEKFCTLTWDGADNDPRGRPLLRRAFPPWKDKLKAAQELLKNLTQFGSPSLIGTTAEQSDALPVTDAAGNATPDQPIMSPEQALLNALLAFQNGSALVLPYGASVTALQVLNAGGSFLKALDSYNNAIAQAVLGASRTVMQAKFGSRADSETAQDVTGLMVRYLQGWLGRMLTRQVLMPLVRYNRGAATSARLCPVASLAPVEHQDWSAVAGAAAKLYPLLQPSQLPWLWEKLGAPPPTESPEEMAGQGQAGGASEDSEDGGDGAGDDAGGGDDTNVDDDVNATAAFAAPVSLAGVDLGDLTREDLLALLVDGALAALEGEAAFAFDPNQPRDESGRWSNTGRGMPHVQRQAGREQAREHVRAFVGRKGPVARREAEALAGHLATLTVDQLHELKREHGLKASAPNKAALVAKLAERFRQAREDRPPDQAPDTATPAGRRQAVKRAIGEVFSRDNGTHPLMQDIAARNDTLEGALRDAARHGLIDHGTTDPNADVMRLNDDRQGAWVTGVFEKVYGEKAGGAKPEPTPSPPAPEPPKPAPLKPGERFLEGRPIAERVAAYEGAKELAARVAAAHEEAIRRSGEMVDALQEYVSHSKRYRELVAEQEKAARRGDEAGAARLGQELAKTFKQKLQARPRLDKAQAEIDAHRDDVRLALLEGLRSTGKVNLPVVAHPDLVPKQHEAAERAVPFVQTVFERDDQTPAQMGVIHAPVDTTHDPLARAHYQGTVHGAAFPTIRTDPDGGASTFVHELGHHLENSVPAVRQAALEFLAHRVGNEPLTKLKDKFPDRKQLKDHEMGREDDFGRYWGKGSAEAYYAGKHYELGDTEIVSMGLQALYEDPAKFAATDPEYFAFVVGVLKGHLRGGKAP